MTIESLAQLPYGAVYFRKSNPPREDWERDYRVAAEDGHNLFRHWFMWSAIEVRPGVFDWDDYDRQFELGARYGIGTIVAEMITAAPEWLYHERPEGRLVTGDGQALGPQMGVSSATGGFYGMCLDDPVVRDAAEVFLTALVERYRDHPSMVGYDVWNECNYRPDSNYNPATLARFRDWLRMRYGDLDGLCRAWQRHSMASWDQVLPPARIEAFRDSLDWLEFQQDNAIAQMRWRIDLIRRLDRRNLVTAHGVAASIVSAADRGSDDWRCAELVDVYGFTWANSRQGDAPYQHLHAVDLARAASRGKPFWHAEAQGGPLWLQPQVLGRPLSDGRVTSATDLRLWNMTSLAGGARAIQFPRWRPLLDGPLFGAFGPYAMDGGRTDRSAMASRIARWANHPDQREVIAARPVQGEVGLLYVPETQVMDFALQGHMRTYTEAMRGAYLGFFDNNVQADFVHIDDIDKRACVYLPYPIMLKRASAERLAGWVEAGGTLICEGLPAYFGDQGRVGQVQPNFGLDALFGVRERDVVFAPDLFDDLRLTVLDLPIEGGAFMQSYELVSATPVGWYDDGACAAATARRGAGRTLLVGTFPSLGYYRRRSGSARTWFARLLEWAGISPRVRTSNPALTARLHEGAGGRRVLWVINHTTEDHSTILSIADPVAGAVVRWGDSGAARPLAGGLAVSVPARDVLVVDLGGGGDG